VPAAITIETVRRAPKVPLHDRGHSLTAFGAQDGGTTTMEEIV
jgi:hypothetical protein